MTDTEMNETIIDRASDASGEKMDAMTAVNLLVSATILTKRHKEAKKVILNRYWKQVEYLISANPRPADVMEVTTEQPLLHKVVLYGARKVEVNNKSEEIVKVKSSAAPEKVNAELVCRVPLCAHNSDKDDNFHFHMAAVSRNVEMAKLILVNSFRVRHLV